MIKKIIFKNKIRGFNSPFFIPLLFNALIMKKFLKKYESAIVWFILLSISYWIFVKAVEYIISQIK